MQINFYKARHIWLNAQNATWTKSDKFDNKIFETLKSEYEELKGSQQKFITVDGKTLFLFYRSGKDFSERPITEITAFLCNENFNNNEKVYKELNSEINDVFEDKLEYSIDIDIDNLKNSRVKIIGVVMSIVVVIIVAFMGIASSPPERILKKDINITNTERILEINTVKEKNVNMDYFNNKIEKNSSKIVSKNDVNTTKKPIKSKEMTKNNTLSSSQETVEVKIDFKEFVEEWNEKVRSLAKKYSLTLEKYKIDEREDVLKQINKFLNYGEGKKKVQKMVYRKTRDIAKYEILNNWIKKRKKKFGKNRISKVIKTSELRKALKENLNFKNPFSNKTIEKILSWNEFELYFEKTKSDEDTEYVFESCKDVKFRVKKNYNLDFDICSEH